MLIDYTIADYTQEKKYNYSLSFGKKKLPGRERML